MLIGGGALWWRLASGPISLDIATPWLTAAIEQNFGNRYRIQVGGTQLERDDQGRTALRLRDIVLRDASGALVAVAPKAEVGISGTSLLMGNPRAESFRLVDANLVVQIEEDGRANVFAGGERPLAHHHAGELRRSREPRPLRPGSRCRRSRSAVSRPIIAACWPGSTALAVLARDGKSLDVAGFDGKDLDRNRHHQRQPHHRRSPQRAGVELHADHHEPDPAGRRAA